MAAERLSAAAEAPADSNQLCIPTACGNTANDWTLACGYAFPIGSLDKTGAFARQSMTNRTSNSCIKQGLDRLKYSGTVGNTLHVHRLRNTPDGSPSFTRLKAACQCTSTAIIGSRQVVRDGAHLTACVRYDETDADSVRVNDEGHNTAGEKSYALQQRTIIQVIPVATLTTQEI